MFSKIREKDFIFIILLVSRMCFILEDAFLQKINAINGGGGSVVL